MSNTDALLLCVSAFSATVYSLMMGSFVVGLLRGRLRSASRCAALRSTARVSVLKPLAGREDELAENLRSFARLDWTNLELLLGVSSLADPAVPVARAFLAANPALDARLVVTDPHAALNPKVAQLLRLAAHATGDVLVVSDANVRVRPSYVRELVAALAEPGVGLVTSVIAGAGERTLGAALENLQLLAYVAPAVVTSATLFGRPVSIGKSMAMRARDLEALGGFGVVGDVLAEDHVLAQTFTRHGHRVRVCMAAVENRNVGCTTQRTLERHTRWGKMRRALAPHGFALEPLLSPIVVTTFALLLSPSRVFALALLASIALQVTGAAVSLLLLRGRVPLWLPPMEVLRSYLQLWAWVCAASSQRVSWRGHEFSLRRGSRLVPAAPKVWPRLRGRARTGG
jgi:ceramide glucosyltransferase